MAKRNIVKGNTAKNNMAFRQIQFKETTIMGQIFSRVSCIALITAVLSLPASLPANAATSSWKIDPAHTAAQFAVKHLMISTVRGAFKGVTGTVVWDDQDVTKSSVDVTIDATTVDTGTAMRDNDLKSASYFDVAKFPTITFKSTKIEQAGAGKLNVTGDLTIHGVTKSVVLAVDGPSAAIKDPWGNTRSAISATTKVNRQDYGVSGGAGAVGDDISIIIDMEMTKQK
jgi:polyisoprenoid-binding protein YceI